MSLKDRIAVRCDEKELSKFKKWCEKINKDHSDVVREMITAAIEGRLTITLSKEQDKVLKGLYK